MRTNEAITLNDVNHKRLNHLGATMGLVVLGSTAVLLAQEPVAHQYSIITVDAPAASSEDIQYTWVNNSGLISQQYQSPIGAPFPLDLHSAVLEKGAWQVIDRPGQPWTGDTNPNSHGQVLVGNFGADGPMSFSGSIWERGTYTPLPEIPGFSYAANGFNDHGQIAGNAFFPDGSVHGFLGNSKAYEIFDYPAEGLVFTIPAMINDAGVVAGEYDVAFGPFSTTVHAFLKEGDQVSNIDLPGMEATSALSINNPGDIVGYYVLEGNRHGFIRSKSGSWSSFDVPGAVQTWISSINDHGQVAGGYQDGSGQTHGFLATPRPRGH